MNFWNAISLWSGISELSFAEEDSKEAQLVEIRCRYGEAWWRLLQDNAGTYVGSPACM